MPHVGRRSALLGGVGVGATPGLLAAGWPGRAPRQSGPTDSRAPCEHSAIRQGQERRRSSVADHSLWNCASSSAARDSSISWRRTCAKVGSPAALCASQLEQHGSGDHRVLAFPEDVGQRVDLLAETLRLLLPQQLCDLQCVAQPLGGLARLVETLVGRRPRLEVGHREDAVLEPSPLDADATSQERAGGTLGCGAQWRVGHEVRRGSREGRRTAWRPAPRGLECRREETSPRLGCPR